MTRTTIQAMTLTAVLALAFGSSAAAGASPATAQQHSFVMVRSVVAPRGASHHRVIVVMKNQPRQAAPGTRAAARRSAAIASAQAPLLRQVRASQATRIISFRLVNAFAATVSGAEAARLRANPNVGEVIRDVLIHGGSAPLVTRHRPASPATGTGLTPHVIPGACGANGSVMLDPEALQTTNTAALSETAKTARSLGITGAGVRVAFIADGLNPSNVNFIRADGRSVFDRAFGGDYQDFTGDGPGQATGGAEAFLDANSIAGQGLHVYNVRDFAAQPDPARVQHQDRGRGARRVPSRPGRVRHLRGHARVEFPRGDQLRGHDRPRQRDQRVVRRQSVPRQHLAERAEAVQRRGGRGGHHRHRLDRGRRHDQYHRLARPRDPKVISVGASTTFRFYAQTNYAAARYFATTGWLNDNVSSLSSGGFTQAAGTISLVAPGDLGFASCSTDSRIYEGCSNLTPALAGRAGGGTSESAPLTAGAAALVIQAYRQTHHGAIAGPGTGQADPDQHGHRPRPAGHRAGRGPAEHLQGGTAGRVGQDPGRDASSRR